jgi:FkbM family methyltransferase
MRKDKISHLDKAIFLPEPLRAELDRGFVSSIPNILKELYIDQVYQQFFLGKSDWLAFDLGAHIGLWSMYASHYCRKIYAIEPESGLFRLLQKNIKYNGYTNIEPLKVALANNNGKANLHQGSQNSTANLMVPRGEDLFEEVECWTIDRLFQETKVEYVDIIKMDIEGAEFGVLGGDHFEKVKDRIGLIIGEMHAWAHTNYDQLRWALQKRGFKVTFPQHNADLFVAGRVK